MNLPKKMLDFVKRFGAVTEADPSYYKKIETAVFEKPIRWEYNIDTDADTFPFKATVDSHSWKLRINDFPNQPMYTLFIDNQPILTFDDKPATWSIGKSNGKSML